MSKINSISSQSDFTSLLSKNTVVVADFYADWCGPCKAISPTYEQLANTHAKPGKMAFAKVNVDNCQDVARQYGVSAMPTFLILKSSTVIETIRGANPAALKAAVQKAASSSDAASGASFSSKGRTLGSDAAPSRPVQGDGQGGFARFFNGIAGTVGGGGAPQAPMALGSGLADSAVRFAGLYLTTLFSFNAFEAAQASPFRVGGGSSGAAAGQGRRL